MKATIKLEGFDELDRKLKALSESMQKEIVNEALLEAAEPMREMASRKAPRRTGKLSKNIIAEVDEKEAQTVNIAPHKDAFYGIFVERGTSKMAAQPFLRPAFDSQKSKSKQIYAAAIKRIIEDVT